MDSPVGAISIPENALREMLANCHYWKNFHGNSFTVAQARSRIYLGTFPMIDTILSDPSFRPIMVIWKAPGTRWSKRAGPNLFVPNGTFVIELYDNADTLDAADPWANERRLQNAVGLIAQSGDSATPGLAELSNSGDYLPIVEMREFGPERADPMIVGAVGDCYLHYLEVDWGVGV